MTDRIVAPEDSEVLALCERWGFDAAMPALALAAAALRAHASEAAHG